MTLVKLSFLLLQKSRHEAQKEASRPSIQIEIVECQCNNLARWKRSTQVYCRVLWWFLPLDCWPFVVICSERVSHWSFSWQNALCHPAESEASEVDFIDRNRFWCEPVGLLKSDTNVTLSTCTRSISQPISFIGESKLTANHMSGASQSPWQWIIILRQTIFSFIN